MLPPSFADSFEVLCLQAASDGRKEVLFGESVDRARKAMRPFLVGKKFPSVYLEFPLAGEPFMDVTVLLNELEPGTHVECDAAAGTEAMLDWYAPVRAEFEDVSCGYELDTSKEDPRAAAVHFQPRSHLELVEPFCEAVGEPERAKLYLDMADRMPPGWDLSFFGMFRGRPGSPLRVCGYLDQGYRKDCCNNPSLVARVFDAIGFSAYDDAMIEQIGQLMATDAKAFDFQFDVYPDGSLGDTFAIDIQFDIERPEHVQASFDSGSAASVMNLLEEWGIADERWRLIPEAAFARSIPVTVPAEDAAERDKTPAGANAAADDATASPELGMFGFTLMPGWGKARWRNGVLQPAKFYFLASAGMVGAE